MRLNPEPVVTYAVDRNINTTNECLFRLPLLRLFPAAGPRRGLRAQPPRSWAVRSTRPWPWAAPTSSSRAACIRRLGVAATCESFRFIKQHHPIHIHGLSPPEVVHMAQVDGLSIPEAIERLRAAGLGSIPGGGAEILVNRVRGLIAPGKCNADQWLEVMAEAHRQGLMTTATMMFGSLETVPERIEHLRRLRERQDDSLALGRGSFTAFIPWTFQPANTALSHVPPATAVDYLRMLAVSRLFLDNFPHVQASWVTQGAGIAQTALVFGADDLGSTMIEENVVAAAGVSFRLPREELVRLAQDLGFAARQRDVFYHPV